MIFKRCDSRVCFGILLCLYALLAVDYTGWFGRSGFIKLSWFTKQALSHGTDMCAHDYEGSWQIGLARATSFEPTNITFSPKSVISCHTITDLPTSFVADPFLHIPGVGEEELKGKWYAFYELKNLIRYNGELGVAVSTDEGLTWRHIAVVLAEPFHLSYPKVIFDRESSIYYMFPETSRSGEGTIRIYTTTPQQFPLGWKLLSASKPGGRSGRYVDTTPLYYKGVWYIFTTIHGYKLLNEPNYMMRLFTTQSLINTDKWIEHPSSPIATSNRVARSGGSAIIVNDTAYRWAQNCENYYGENLVLLRIDELTPHSYRETVVSEVMPSRSKTWRGQRIHHMDLHLMPDGSWMGLADGDRMPSGDHHYFQREHWFIQLKHVISRVLFFLLVTYVAAWGMSAYGSTVSTFVKTHMPLRYQRVLPLSIQHWLADHASSSVGSKLDSVCSYARPSILLQVLFRRCPFLFGVSGGVIAVLASYLIFRLIPGAFYCPASFVSVPTSKTFQPDHPFVDPRAPYPVSNLQIVTGCSMSFFDRLENLVASIQTWEPKARVIVYDMGFSSEQMKQIMCWKNVDLRPANFDRFPDHVSDLTNFAFKGILIDEVLQEQESGDAVLWLDCGAELRNSLNRARTVLQTQGHVSSIQSMAVGDHPFTKKYMAPFVKIDDQEFERVAKSPLCAGGLQGFVKGSSAEKLILNEVVRCSLEPMCILPETGATIKESFFDQSIFSLMIHHHNFSTCQPASPFFTASVKKLSYNPLKSSGPVSMASRRHRYPKPYVPYLKKRAHCRVGHNRIGWQTSLPQAGETTLKSSSLGFKIKFMYLQAVGDFFVQGGSCVGVHFVALLIFWVLYSLLQMGFILPPVPTDRFLPLCEKSEKWSEEGREGDGGGEREEGERGGGHGEGERTLYLGGGGKGGGLKEMGDEEMVLMSADVKGREGGGGGGGGHGAIGVGITNNNGGSGKLHLGISDVGISNSNDHVNNNNNNSNNNNNNRGDDIIAVHVSISNAANHACLLGDGNNITNSEGQIMMTCCPGHLGQTVCMNSSNCGSNNCSNSNCRCNINNSSDTSLTAIGGSHMNNNSNNSNSSNSTAGNVILSNLNNISMNNATNNINSNLLSANSNGSSGKAITVLGVESCTLSTLLMKGKGAVLASHERIMESGRSGLSIGVSPVSSVVPLPRNGPLFRETFHRHLISSCAGGLAMVLLYFVFSASILAKLK